MLKVLPNGNLFVAGEKQIALNQGNEYVRVTGVVRPIDLAADNSIPSSQGGERHDHLQRQGRAQRRQRAKLAGALLQLTVGALLMARRHA